MSSQKLLSDGNKYYSYSGEVFGDVSAPATIQLILIPNTGLKDSLVQIQQFFGKAVSTTQAHQLGITVKLDDVTVINSQRYQNYGDATETFQLFVPRQSKIEVISNNTPLNNTQIRGANLMGYYL